LLKKLQKINGLKLKNFQFIICIFVNNSTCSLFFKPKKFNQHNQGDSRFYIYSLNEYLQEKLRAESERQ
ncbi:hypothetical protein B6D60_09960, partial [candidate division KSB1 bacterium 4484_87]